MHSAYAAKFYAAILTSSVSKGMLKVFMSRYNAHLRGADVFTVSPEEMAQLVAAVEKVEPRCTPEHEKSGMDFLMDKLFTPKGNIRKTPEAAQFTANDALFMQMVYQRESYAIHWVGTRYVGSGHLSHLPIFRVSSTVPLLGKLRAIEYCASSWQSGGWFEIVDREERPWQ